MKTKICPRCRRQIPLPLWSGTDHVRIDDSYPITMHREGDEISIKAIAHQDTCFDFWAKAVRKTMRPLKLRPEEEKMTLEELAISWTERAKSLGREDRWGVINGWFVKVHWEGKEDGTPPYRYVIIGDVLYHPKPFDER